MQKVTISVVMACHNCEAFLGDAIDSILNQTFPDWELLVVDDGSSDCSVDIAHRYRLDDDRVSIVCLPSNRGPAIARNSAIELSRGEWIGILDADDISMPSRFEMQVSTASRDPSIVMVASDSVTLDANGNTGKRRRYPTADKDLRRRLADRRAFPPHSSMLYRRKAVEQVGLFNPRFTRSQDRDLWLRLAEHGAIRSISAPLVAIRQHESNISRTDGGRLQLRMGTTATVCHFLRIGGHPDPARAYDTNVWDEFLRWIDERLEEEGVYALARARFEARSMLQPSSRPLLALPSVGLALAQGGHLASILRERLVGSTLPRRLAAEWASLIDSPRYD